MELYSIDQVAEVLGLHVRTVRSYVREGRLKAVRIGKQYRIAREDLAALTGGAVPAPARETARRTRHVEASSIVEIDAIAPAAADRIANTLVAAANSRSGTDEPLRVQTLYDEERARMKVVILGGVNVAGDILRLIGTLMESE